ncbi:hypothetical protein ACFVYP_07140 [Kitasatospora sp. NPDC058201]|uniref:hypothetical protein n=1 Tax=unclassified Kitasatospora TaxID=2633591 RepID=UPI0036480242
MTERTISSPEQPEAERGACGVCRRCLQYGHGQQDGARDLIDCWIVDHVGCTAQVTAEGPRQ